jgi:hypothetical protein
VNSLYLGWPMLLDLSDWTENRIDALAGTRED